MVFVREQRKTKRRKNTPKMAEFESDNDNGSVNLLEDSDDNTIPDDNRSINLLDDSDDTTICGGEDEDDDNADDILEYDDETEGASEEEQEFDFLPVCVIDACTKGHVYYTALPLVNTVVEFTKTTRSVASPQYLEQQFPWSIMARDIHDRHCGTIAIENIHNNNPRGRHNNDILLRSILDWLPEDRIRMIGVYDGNYNDFQSGINGIPIRIKIWLSTHYCTEEERRVLARKIKNRLADLRIPTTDTRFHNPGFGYNIINNSEVRGFIREEEEDY